MKNKLSADPAALVLGIISIVIIFFGCCCGFFAVLSLVLGIVGLVMANKSLQEYAQNPEDYNYKSKEQVYIGKVLCIISIVISALLILAFSVYFIIFGGELSEKFLENYNNIKAEERQIQSDDDESVYKYEVNDTVADTTAAD